MSVWGNRRWRWSPLALISSAADSVGCTPEGSGDESLITAGHCCCVCSWGQELLYYLLLSHWAFRWSWHHLTPHLPCSQTLLYKNTLNAHRWLYTHFHFFFHICCFFSEVPAHDEANSIFGCWFFVSVCKVSVWHLGERYACAAWHYDSLDILDLNVAHAVLHHNMSP